MVEVLKLEGNFNEIREGFYSYLLCMFIDEIGSILSSIILHLFRKKKSTGIVFFYGYS